MGFRHETANLQLQFDRVIQNGVPTAIHARVLAVDNAREKVKNGVIRGNRSTKTLHGFVGNTLGVRDDVASGIVLGSPCCARNIFDFS